MGIEIDLLASYPKTKRDVKKRGLEKSEADRALAREFGKDFFDGDRKVGYGGFNYDPRYWEPVIPAFKEHFKLTANSSVLDVGCAKGFMLYDLTRLIPGIQIAGIDVSEYAIANAKLEVKPFLKVADVRNIPFEDHSFDLVVAINTIHNLEYDECLVALKEIERVSRSKSFITVDAYRTQNEKEVMNAWNLTANTILSVDDWKELFDKAGYTGDYYWFMPL